MASSINASTTAGVVTTADTSGVLNIQTAGTTAVTVDASQRVGIGTASPATKLNISSAGADVEVRASTTTSGNVRFGFDVDGAYYNWIQANRSSGAIQFAISNSEVMQINAVGGLKVINTIGVGNATPSTSGAGITFPATQSASTDANTLDDYEEGTFTPSFTFGGGSTGITYSATRRIGTYTKIGNKVFYFIHIELTSKGSSTGQALITGLPFTSTGNDAYVPASVFIASMASITGQIMPRSSTGSTTIDIYQVVSSSYSGITDTNFTNTTGFQVSGMFSTT
jgi:hypothetical protein